VKIHQGTKKEKKKIKTITQNLSDQNRVEAPLPTSVLIAMEKRPEHIYGLKN
jgi:hypothetical protein